MRSKVELMFSAGLEVLYGVCAVGDRTTNVFAEVIVGDESVLVERVRAIVVALYIVPLQSNEVLTIVRLNEVLYVTCGGGGGELPGGLVWCNLWRPGLV